MDVRRGAEGPRVGRHLLCWEECRRLRGEACGAVGWSSEVHMPVVLRGVEGLSCSQMEKGGLLGPILDSRLFTHYYKGQNIPRVLSFPTIETSAPQGPCPEVLPLP